MQWTQAGWWQLPSDRQFYNDTETRAHMEELLSRVPNQNNQIYPATVFVITNNGQKIRIVAVAADMRLFRGIKHLRGEFILKDFILKDDSVQLWTQQNVAAVLHEQEIQRMAARVSDGLGNPSSGYRLVLTIDIENFPHILLAQANDYNGPYLRLPGGVNNAMGSTNGREAMEQLLTAFGVTTGIFTIHEKYVGDNRLLFFIAHVPARNGSYRKCHFPVGTKLVPLTADILKGQGFAQSTQVALKMLRDEVKAIDF